MQSNDIEFEFTPSILNTPSIAPPNLVPNRNLLKVTFDETPSDYPGELDNSTSTNSPNSHMLNSSNTESGSSADAKVSQIEDALKESLSQPRKPTPSPFERMATGALPIPRSGYTVSNDDGTTTEIPSTADVVLVLESLTNTSCVKGMLKPSVTESKEIGQTSLDSNDNTRCDSLTVTNMASATASPKKIFLLRSQSINESNALNSANQSNHSNTNSFNRQSNNEIQSLVMSNGLDDENLIVKSSGHQYERTQNLANLTALDDSMINGTDSFRSMQNGNDQSYIEQQHVDTNGLISTSLPKQPQQVLITGSKRSSQQISTTHLNSSMTKANTLSIPISTLVNEVTSSDQLPHAKRQKTMSMSNNSNPVGFRNASGTSTTSASTAINTAHSPNAAFASDDQRKKQIRDSNREAARRCRERRRQYIEQLEGNLEQSKAQIKQLSDKLTRLERENMQLRTLISETKIGHPGSRLPSNETMVEYVNAALSASVLDLNSDQTDAGSLQRSYINRNNL